MVHPQLQQPADLPDFKRGPPLQLYLWRVSKVDGLGENQTDPSSLVHDGRATERTRHLGGSLVFPGSMGRIVKGQARGTFVEIHVRFMEDGSPLEGSAYRY